VTGSTGFVRLSHIDQGTGEPELLILHGLFGSARNWAGLAKRFAETRRVVAVDARNHGGSPWDDDMAYPAMAADLLEQIDTLGLTRPVVLGHSMGGKTAMYAALSRPEKIGALIVADMAPVAYRHTHMPLVVAMRALDLARVRRRAEADAALAPVAPQQAMRDFLLQNLVFENGRARWRLNLAAIAMHLPGLLGWDSPAPAAPFAGPALFVHGGRSAFVRPEYHETIRRLFPAARIETITGAGHWLHADRPAEFAVAVERFLATLG
jgi:pimeloyl-ACP methyl ester carboxylesterase